MTNQYPALFEDNPKFPCVLEEGHAGQHTLYVGAPFWEEEVDEITREMLEIPDEEAEG